MNEIKNLIIDMLSKMTTSPENIAEIATRDKKLVLLLDSDSKEFGSQFDSIILVLNKKKRRVRQRFLSRYWLCSQICRAIR